MAKDGTGQRLSEESAEGRWVAEQRSATNARARVKSGSFALGAVGTARSDSKFDLKRTKKRSNSHADSDGMSAVRQEIRHR